MSTVRRFLCCAVVVAVTFCWPISAGERRQLQEMIRKRMRGRRRKRRRRCSGWGLTGGQRRRRACWQAAANCRWRCTGTAVTSAAWRRGSWCLSWAHSPGLFRPVDWLQRSRPARSSSADRQSTPADFQCWMPARRAPWRRSRHSRPCKGRSASRPAC